MQNMQNMQNMMQPTEDVIGIRFTAEPTAENIAHCSELSAAFFAALVERHCVTYHQILYPYADALSLSGRPDTRSTRIFGTHMLLRRIDRAQAESVMKECFPNGGTQYEITEIPLYEGAAMSAEIAQFLRVQKECLLPSAGEFADMLGGYVAHWRIRESARVFASFSEMAYRRAKGEICGLYGGRLILTPACDCAEAIQKIFTRKTGCK